MEPIKPGTQCECHHRFDGESGLIRNGHEYAHRINEYSLNEHCTRDAVRMVIVENDNIGDDWIKHGLTGIPMCAACAEWHEKGAR